MDIGRIIQLSTTDVAAVAVAQGQILGEDGTGYENGNKGPFRCSNCRYFSGSCGQKIMMAKSKLPRLPNGRVKVDAAGCCEYVDRVGRRT